ncbi:hypothetical protein V1512DRAFT_200525 [Lipomyces arxii]|uniref:uncharacterized protein n=1 Tax=Lipomyces arxii TaxID=56418 RepID=UPI0034CF0693
MPVYLKDLKDLKISLPLPGQSSHRRSTSENASTSSGSFRQRRSNSIKGAKKKFLNLPTHSTFWSENTEERSHHLKFHRPHLHRVKTDNSTDDEKQYLHVHQMDNARFRAVKESIKSSISIDQINSLVFSTPPKDGFPDVDGDVVVMGGYRGSILRDAKTKRRVWIPMKVGLNIRRINLEIGLTDEDESRVEEDIIPDGMLKAIGPVDMCSRLIKRLQMNRECHVHDYGYDWRLSLDKLSMQFVEYLRKLKSQSASPEKGIIVIAHSMGGVVAHGAMQIDPSLFRGLLYVGAPSSSVNILGPFRNGENVLLSTKVLSAQVTFSMRSSFIFLPLDGRCFLDKNTGKEIKLDFFDASVWEKYGLSPCVARGIQQKNESTHEKIADTVAGAAKPALDEVTAPAGMSEPPAPNEAKSTLPRAEAVEYLQRTLTRTKEFKHSLMYDLSKNYPPLAIVYGRTVPTVAGARVFGEKDIYDGDYSDMIFVPGDGVVAARNIMPPEGFPICAKIRSTRGHVGLLGDIVGIGEALDAILQEENRRKENL